MGIHALVGLWLIYALGRSVGLAAGWAWLGALLLAASPLYVYSSLQTLSDLPAMCGDRGDFMRLEEPAAAVAGAGRPAGVLRQLCWCVPPIFSLFCPWRSLSALPCDAG